MGRGKRRNKRRRNNFVAINALQDGDSTIAGLIREAKRHGSINQNHPQRAEEARAVADKAVKVADAVTELFLLRVPSVVTAPVLVKAVLNFLYSKDLVSVDELTQHQLLSGTAAKSSVLRCEIQKSRRGTTSNAFISMRTEELAQTLIHCSPLPVLGYFLKVMKNNRVSVPGVGSAWRASCDPGSMRWKIGTVQVGEKISEDLFSSFWTSSPFFDLSENSHVELSPVDKAVAITVGRPQTMMKAQHMLGGFVRTSCMLRLVIPFQSICASPIAEKTNRASEGFAVHFPISRPPLLFRAEDPSNHTVDLYSWDCLGGVGQDIRWIRTIDPTPSSALTRTRAIRIMLSRSEMYGFFKELHRLCISDVSRPTPISARAQGEKEPPNRSQLFRQASWQYRIPFAVRYMVECVLSLRTVRLADIGSEFWRTLADDLSEEDAVKVLDCMHFRLSDNDSFTTINDPLAVLRECITMCNIKVKGSMFNASGPLGYSEDSDRDTESDDVSVRTESTDEILMETYVRDLKLDELNISGDGNESPESVENEAFLPPARSRKPSRQHAYIRRLICTPTRAIALRAESDLLNRVLREYAEHKDRFLRISFSDEDGGSIAFAGSDDLYARVRTVLRDGMECAGDTFVFLAFSNSQLRDHAAWMYNETPDASSSMPPTADMIRKWMGDFSKIRVPGKFAARQGQAFSSTVGTVLLQDVQEAEIKDIKDVSGQYTFSDGVGLMSSDLAGYVAHKLRIRRSKKLPSAFQVRYGGAKGMLTVWDDMLPRNGPIEVALRPSMKKFDCKHKALEIVGYAKRLPLFLNRQIIMLLSGKGVPDEPFEEMQRNLLRSLDRAMETDGASEALDLLFTSGCGESDAKLRISGPMMNAAAFFRVGLNCTSCEHLFNMMYAFRRRTIRDLMQRARIPIDGDKGVCAIGVMDELGVLQPNEIFCRFTKPASGETMVVKGLVTVGRSPCLHPGDIQPVLAVDKPALHHLIDVIVFPKIGWRPMPSMLSGGDLDGDIFFCIFDKRIAQSLSYPPMNYSAPKPVELDHDVTTSDIADFFVQYIRNDKLGQIANAHVVHADKENKGIFSEKCLQLATLHSTAVDFAKTGVPADVARELYPRNQAGQYPDFMGKHAKVSYPSRKVLGKLFRACNASQSGRENDYKFFPNPSSTEVDAIIDRFPDDHGLLKEAELLCAAYNFDLLRLMEQYGVLSEGEIITGQVMSFAARHAQLRGRREYFALVMRLNRQTNELRSYYREEFFQGLGKRAIDGYSSDTLIKACTWHKACRRLAEADRARNGPVLVSFPWVVSDVLLRIIGNELRDSSE